MIDLNLPVMAERAVDLLIARLEKPDSPRILLLQSPKLQFSQEKAEKYALQ